MARTHEVGLVLETRDLARAATEGAKLGYREAALANANRQAIRLPSDLHQRSKDAIPATVISGCVGPRGDGCELSNTMTAGEAERPRRVTPVISPPSRPC